MDAVGRQWLWYLAAVAFAAALYLAGPLNTGPVFNLIGASSAVAVIVGARRHRPRGRIAWYAIALGEILFVSGDVLAYNYERLFGGELPFPSIADPLYLAMYPLLVGGLMTLLHLSRPARDRGALIDGLIVTIGVATLSWAYLMAPYAQDGSLTGLELMTSLAYPVADVLLVAVAAALLLRRHPGPSARMLGCGLLALLVTDGVYGWLVLHGGYDTGGLLDGGWIVFYALIGAAALHPSMRQLSEPGPAEATRLTRGRVVLLGAASLVAPGVSLVRYLLDQPRAPIVNVCAAVVFMLVLVRLAARGPRAGAGDEGHGPAALRAAPRRARPQRLRRRVHPARGRHRRLPEPLRSTRSRHARRRTGLVVDRRRAPGRRGVRARVRWPRCTAANRAACCTASSTETAHVARWRRSRRTSSTTRRSRASS